MIFGLHNVAEALKHYWESRISSDGGLGILYMDGLLLIPAIFALFFYPMAVLIGAGVVLLVTGAIYEVMHYARTHHIHGLRHR
jgi:hypothetical protein